MKLYRKVDASKRLPGQGEHMTNQGWLEYDYEEGLWMFLNSFAEWVIVDDVVWWLEPIEITEKEIYDIVSKAIIVHDDIFGVSMDSAKAILSKLTGDE
jgi:hypothetical protein